MVMLDLKSSVWFDRFLDVMSHRQVFDRSGIFFNIQRKYAALHMLLSHVGFGDDVVYNLGLLIASPSNRRVGLAKKGNGTILVSQERIDAMLLPLVGSMDLGGGWIERDVTVNPGISTHVV